MWRRRIHNLSNAKILSSLLLVFVCSLSVGCRKYFLTYPYPWDYSKEKPKEFDVAGDYKITKLRIPSGASSGIDQDAHVTLKSDGTAVFTAVPEFNISGKKPICRLSGSATWKLETRKVNGVPWVLQFQNFVAVPKPVVPKCDLGSEAFGEIVVIGRKFPYRLYQIVGDPDDDAGIEFQRLEHLQ